MSSIWLAFLLTISLLANATTLALAGFDEGKTAFDGKAYSEAQEEWRPLAEKGHTRAQYWMGVLYYSGYGVEKDYGQAASWWQKAAEKEHRNAQYWLGVLQFRGRGVPQSYEIAAQWWQRAVQPRGVEHESFAPAFQQLFGQLFSENASAQAGHWLAHLYASGKGIPQDSVKAHILYNLLIALPGPSEQARDRARKALNQVSSEMDAESLARAEDILGLFTGLFALTKNDTEQAIRFLAPLAERAKVFGVLFEVFPAAIEELTKTMPRSVTELGISVRATTILPFVMAVSLDNAENYPEANKWWQELAKMGDGFAMAQIGSRYLNGVGIEANLDDAVHWFRKGAEQGNASTQYLLGSLYFRGEGVAEDKVQAANWYREAAEQGSALAQNELGAMYENGIGVSKEDTEAVKWYRMAAEHGLADAQYNLGTMYERGRGLPHDDAEAAKWYDMAAEQGLVEARERLSQREEERLSQREEEEREGRRIPVARSDSSTLSGRVLLAISGWLDGLVGAGSSTLHLKLAAPMSSEEQNGAVTVRAPGAQLFFLGFEDGYLDLGDLESKVRPLSDVEFGFEFSLPSQLRVDNATASNKSYISIDQSAFSGVWRSDIETTTLLDIDVRNVTVFDRVSGADKQIGTLESASANQELRQTDGDLWDGQLAFNLQNLHADIDGTGGLSIGDISVESELHAVDVWAFARLSEVVEDVNRSQDVGSVDLARVLEEFQAIEWGSSTTRLTMGDLVGRENGVVNISLGGVLWETRLSKRGDFMDLGMVIGAHDFVGKDALEQTISPDVVPNAVRVDFAIADFPFLSSISTVLELMGKHTDDGPSVAADDVMGMLLGKMVEAGSQIKIESLNVAAPLYSIAASAEFLVDPTSAVGFVGGATATVTGLDEVTKLVAGQAKTNPGASSIMTLLVLVQGIGQPVMTEGSGGTTFIYELQVPSNGVISVNETPLNVLLGGNGE